MPLLLLLLLLLRLLLRCGLPFLLLLRLLLRGGLLSLLLRLSLRRGLHGRLLRLPALVLLRGPSFLSNSLRHVRSGRRRALHVRLILLAHNGVPWLITVVLALKDLLLLRPRIFIS